MKLDVTELSTIYETSQGSIYAVNDVDFNLTAGQSVGIAGESACGKSTLGLSIIRTSTGKSSGNILFDDILLLNISDTDFDKKYRWKKISMIFQGAMNSLDPVFTINEQFKEILTQHDFDGDADQTIIDAITSVNLEKSVLKKYPHELSGGMKQRVIIAMALLLKPELVIADEPTTALDVLTQAQIIRLFKSLKEQNTSFMIITHDLAVLSEIADTVGIMYGGQMVEFGSSNDIYKDPKHPYTQGLLKSIPTLHGSKPVYIRGTPPSLLEPPTECRFIGRCPEAMEKCHSLPPKFKTKSGYVRCWLYE